MALRRTRPGARHAGGSAMAKVRHSSPHGTPGTGVRRSGRVREGAIEIAHDADLGRVMYQFVEDVHDEADDRFVAIRTGDRSEGPAQVVVSQGRKQRAPEVVAVVDVGDAAGGRHRMIDVGVAPWRW